MAAEASVSAATNARPTGFLKQLAIRGLAWTTAGFGLSQILRFGFNLILTRLLFPDLFGLMTLMYTLVTGLHLFSDVGIQPAIVRDARGDDPDFLNTAWTMQILRGVALACLCGLIAWPAALFYRDQRIKWILPVLGVSVAVSGFNSTSLFRIQRHMEVSKVVVMEVWIQIVSGLVMVVWAWLAPSIWALMSGALSATVIRVVWSHALKQGSADRLMWDRTALRDLLRFGRWIWIATVLTFLASQIDRLVLGKLFSLATLGIYSIACSIAEFPRGLTMSINSNVIYPAYSKTANMPRADFREDILRHRWPLLLALACIIAFLSAGGDILIRFFYDKRYSADAWMLPVLAIGLWPSAVAYTIDSSLFAIGHPSYAPLGNLWKLLFTAIGVPVAFSIWRAPGAVFVVALNDFPYYAQIAYGLSKQGLSSLAQDAKCTLALLVILALLLTLRWMLGWGLPVQGLL